MTTSIQFLGYQRSRGVLFPSRLPDHTRNSGQGRLTGGGAVVEVVSGLAVGERPVIESLQPVVWDQRPPSFRLIRCLALNNGLIARSTMPTRIRSMPTGRPTTVNEINMPTATQAPPEPISAWNFLCDGQCGLSSFISVGNSGAARGS